MLIDLHRFFVLSPFASEHGKPVLLAVSGGVDSVVMAHLFHRSAIPFAIAHCNFRLRGEESEGDAQFVSQLAEHFGVPFHLKAFDTIAYADDNRLSIQMAARKLRYDYFHELHRDHRYRAIAVAHHADDVAETMLLNMVRGAGIAGVHGMASVQGLVVRPLLSLTGDEIRAYALKHELVWREDSSNAEVFYTRNRIRHRVIPVLREINPAATEAMLRHARLMHDYEELLKHFISGVSRELVRQQGTVTSVNLSKLMELPSQATLLYHLLYNFGFTATQCRQMVESPRTGAEFYSHTHKLVTGREVMEIIPIPETGKVTGYHLHENSVSVELPHGTLTMERVSKEYFEGGRLPDDFTDPQVAYVDSSLLEFPLHIRSWHHGDTFSPLGMQGRKLVSDFFTDEKFTPSQKEFATLLLSGEQIVWLIGHRIDHRYRIKSESTMIRRFEWREIGHRS